MVLPTECPFSEGLLAGICRTKVKVPAVLFHGDWGAVVTNDLCIRFLFVHVVMPPVDALLFDLSLHYLLRLSVRNI